MTLFVLCPPPLPNLAQKESRQAKGGRKGQTSKHRSLAKLARGSSPRACCGELWTVDLLQSDEDPMRGCLSIGSLFLVANG